MLPEAGRGAGEANVVGMLGAPGDAVLLLPCADGAELPAVTGTDLLLAS